MASEIPTRAPNGFVVIVGGAAMLVAVAGVFIGIVGATGSGGENLEQRRAAKRLEIRTQLEKEAQERLTSFGWDDPARKTVHMPINDAIAAVVRELKDSKPKVSKIKVEPPLPMPVIDPNSKEPPAPALPSAPQGADTIRFDYPFATPEPAATPAPPVPATPAPAKPATPPPAPAVAPPPPAPAPPAAPPAPAAVTPPAPAPVPAPPASSAPIPPAPAPVTPPAPAPEAPPAPPPAPAPAVPPAATPSPAAPAPAAPAPAAPPAATPAPPAPAAAPEAPARPPIINPTENSEPTK